MLRYMSLTEIADYIGVKPATLGRYKLPEPDAMIGSTRGWNEANIYGWNANRPGKGAGAGRPKKTGESR